MATHIVSTRRQIYVVCGMTNCLDNLGTVPLCIWSRKRHISAIAKIMSAKRVFKIKIEKRENTKLGTLGLFIAKILDEILLFVLFFII
jgi:hypothetical protein